MLDFFKKKQGTSGTAANEAVVLDMRTICRLMRHFPVGAKIQYYPEYRKEIVLDSVVIAYAINDRIIYSCQDLVCDDAGTKLEFTDQGQRHSFKKIERFRILLPVFSQSETKLDYVRREELLKIGGLVTGNVITLMAQQEGGQVPVIETTVEKRSILKEGFYVNQTVAFLEVDAETLMLSDQRAHLRLKTHIPATVQVRKKREYSLLNAMMMDFSDRSLRLQVDEEFPEQAMPKEKDALVVSFNLPGQSEYVSLVGDVFRVEDRAMVVMLTGYVEKGQVVNLGQIEILKIKANLLQNANTNLAK
jgi:hypothetical protein